MIFYGQSISLIFKTDRCRGGFFKIYDIKDSLDLFHKDYFFILKNQMSSLIILRTFICSLYSIILTHDGFSLITYFIFCLLDNLYFVTPIAMHNQNRTCLKNKNNNWTHSVFLCLFVTNMLIPVLWNIYTFTCIKNTLRERWLFQCQQAEFRRKETLYWIKYCEKLLERLF